MKLSIIIPVYNEKELLPTVLEKVRKINVEKELILVDDCSTDGTVEIFKTEGKNPDTIVFYHTVNKGKGAAIRTGLEHFTGDIVIIQDADLEYNPDDIPKVIQPIIDGRCEVAYGSRFLGSIKKMKLPNFIANKLLAWLISILYKYKITDEATAYKAFSRKAIKSINLKCERFEFCPEVTSKILKKGYKIIEVPVSFEARTFEEGKKIGWRDFIVAVRTIFHCKFYND